jgi:hypothetical protein
MDGWMDPAKLAPRKKAMDAAFIPGRWHQMK